MNTQDYESVARIIQGQLMTFEECIDVYGNDVWQSAQYLVPHGVITGLADYFTQEAENRCDCFRGGLQKHFTWCVTLFFNRDRFIRQCYNAVT